MQLFLNSPNDYLYKLKNHSHKKEKNEPKWHNKLSTTVLTHEKEDAFILDTGLGLCLENGEI